MLQPGSHFERYVVEGVLGQGAMGCVYRATDTRLQRKVALKVLAPDPDSGALPMEASEAIHRMRREALASAKIDHPNAVQVFDVGEFQGCPYIAMELINGRPLRSYQGALDVPWTLKLRWLIDVAKALGTAHRVGLIHRDVKPDNVMIRDDGVVKVLDFGIVRAVSDEALSASTSGVHKWTKLTVDGRILGTPAYMAPEQLNATPLDGRSDQFSWGVMAYELFVGALPWDTSSKITALFVTILTQEIVDMPGPGGSSLPAGVRAAILKTLKKNPNERFSSMEELIATLEPYLSAPRAQPTPVPGLGAPQQMGRGYTVPMLPPSEQQGWQTPSGRMQSPGHAGPSHQGYAQPPTQVFMRPAANTKAPIWVAVAAALLVFLLGGALLLLRHRMKSQPGGHWDDVQQAPYQPTFAIGAMGSPPSPDILSSPI